MLHSGHFNRNMNNNKKDSDLEQCEQSDALSPGLLGLVCSQQQGGDVRQRGVAPLQPGVPSVSVKHALHTQGALCKRLLDLLTRTKRKKKICVNLRVEKLRPGGQISGKNVKLSRYFVIISTLQHDAEPCSPPTLSSAKLYNPLWSHQSQAFAAFSMYSVLTSGACPSLDMRDSSSSTRSSLLSWPSERISATCNQMSLFQSPLGFPRGPLGLPARSPFHMVGSRSRRLSVSRACSRFFKPWEVG